MRGKAVSGEEYIRLCDKHTASEIAEIMEISKEFVSKLQAKHKIKPKRECSECHKRFDPVRNEKMCPECKRQRNIQNTSHQSSRNHTGSRGNQKHFKLKRKCENRAKIMPTGRKKGQLQSMQG